MSQTVKARIAVCVDPKGDWCAAGWGTATKALDSKAAMSTALDGVDEGEARYWIEVDLPLPSVPVIAAVAEPDQ